MLVNMSCDENQVVVTAEELVEAASMNTTGITVEELKDKIDNGEMILLVDVREPMEYNAGYIPGALNIPRGVLEFKINNDQFWEEAMLYMPLPEEEIIV